MGLQAVMFFLAAGLMAQNAGQSVETSRDSPLVLSVRPDICLSPCAVLARAWVERDASNRTLTLVADSPEYRRASTQQLEGERAARLHSMVFKHLAPGIYRIEVRLEQSDGRVLVRSHVIEVKSGP